jgi:hypothetical protein
VGLINPETNGIGFPSWRVRRDNYRNVGAWPRRRLPAIYAFLPAAPRRLVSRHQILRLQQLQWYIDLAP